MLSRPPSVEVHCFGGLVVLVELVLGGVVELALGGGVVFVVELPVVPVVPVVVVVPVFAVLLNCCEAFRKASGSFAIWLCASGWAFR